MTDRISTNDRVLGGLWGSLIGDALGVPVEFRNRDELQKDPVTGMRGHGSHHQPKGTWSDDGALILCTIDSLVNSEFDTTDMGHRFVRWMNEALWTATGEVFDVGMTTTGSLMRIANGTPAENAGDSDEYSNGNGSLMRIIPVALRFASEPAGAFARRVELASAITHGHERSRMACVLYSLIVRQLYRGCNPRLAIESAREDFSGMYGQSRELKRFRHLLTENFQQLPEGEIVSTGYVLHTLHASLWCLLNTQDFRQCVLKAVNLGGDTDTTGCVAGGLAGLAYGMQSVPRDWADQLARKGDLDCLFREFTELCLKSNETSRPSDRGD